jgi:CDP-glucose 4,6-dehydratase
VAEWESTLESMEVKIDKNFWTGKRVFLTGHTGFKGSWLSLWLSSMGADVKGYSLEPPTLPSLFIEAKVSEKIHSEIGDIRNLSQLKKSVTSFNPDILFHMAAQPLVRYSYDNPIETYEVNVIGTAKVLEASRSCQNLKAIINITTDKCYENKNYDKAYKEDDPMGGHDPYSSSKGCSELLTASYRRSFFESKGVGLASVRAGNVIGGGDWAKDRLIPDILKSFQAGKKVIIRNPLATRPWQHVLEPLSGYLILAQKLFDSPINFSQGWNFGPKEKDVKPVNWIVDKMSSNWSQSAWELEKDAQPHEADFLKLDINKAQLSLNWNPTWSLETTLEKIIIWHKAWINKENMQKISIDEINKYMDEMDCENYY